MSDQSALNQWFIMVTTHLPHLSKPQAAVLALWSFAIAMIKSCGLTSVTVFLATLLGKKEDALRQRLREGYYDADDKKGDRRRDLEVSTCFAPLLRWVLEWWSAEECRLALALDATTLGQRFTVLVISILYRGCAIPVAWKVLPATKPGAWRPHWLALFEHLRGSIPADWTVIVLADRGLYARWLYRQVTRLGWHPFFRINGGGKFRPAGENHYRPLAQVVPQAGMQWCGQVICFKSQPLACTLLARWEVGQAEPWLIITDLSPQQADVCWYALRPWIEGGFQDIKRGGWQWQYTRMTDPRRAERLWLGMALATLWTVSVGGEADATLPASSLAELPPTHRARRRAKRNARPRRLSCFRRGSLVILATLLRGQPLPFGCFYPEAWPCSAPAPP